VAAKRTALTSRMLRARGFPVRAASLACALLVFTLATARALPAAADQLAESSPTHDYYLDAKGRAVRFSPAYQSWFGPNRYERQYVRALAENGIITVLEFAVYWYDPHANSVDWQYPDVQSKLSSSEAVRFDDNLMRSNYLYHPFAGQMHYWMTRVNGFGIPESSFVAALNSTLYEMVWEWRELVSINDLVVTPVGGTAAGEFFHQLGNYLNSEPPHVHTDVRQSIGSVARGGTRVTLGLPRAMHDDFDDPPYPLRLEPDNLGLSSAYHHDFRLSFGLDTVSNESDDVRQMYSFGGRFEIAAMPGFLRPGEFGLWFFNGNFVASDVRLAFGRRSGDIELKIDSDLFGYYRQAIRPAPGGAEGFANETAFGTGLRYLDRSLFGRRDQIGIVHLFRPVQRVWLCLGPARLKLSADISPDFAALHSAAYKTWMERFGTDGTKSSLQAHGYWHGWGISAGAGVGVELGAIELSGRARHGRYESIDGWERAQEEVTRDTTGTETVTDLEASVALEPEGGLVSARAEYAETRRGSTLESIRAERLQRRLTVSLGLRF